MNKCERCGVYTDEAEHALSGLVLCFVCRENFGRPQYRVRQISTGCYLEVCVCPDGRNVSLVTRWITDKKAVGTYPRDVAEALGKCVIHVTGDRGLEVEPVEN